MRSHILIASPLEEGINSIEYNNIIKFVRVDNFLVDDVALVVEKAYLTSQEPEVLLLASKNFSVVVQNRLLKILEEPPKNKIFVLITENKSILLDTILSRLPLFYGNNKKEEENLELDVSSLNLKLIYEFVQKHKRADSIKIKRIIEVLFKEVINSKVFILDTQTLKLFDNSTELLTKGGIPSFILLTLLLKLLNQRIPNNNISNYNKR